MTAETLKPFISSPSSEHFSPEDPPTKRQPNGNIFAIGINVTCVAFAIVILVFMIWSSVRIIQLEAEVKSVARLVESMKKKLGLDYLEDLADLEYANGLIDDPRSVEEENEESGTLLSSDPLDYDEGDEKDDLLGGINDNYEDDDDDDDDDGDDVSTVYPDDSEADSYENDGDNLYDDFEKYKDAKKLRKARSIDSAPGLPIYEESYAQRRNKSGGTSDQLIEHQLLQGGRTLRPLEHSSVEPQKNYKESRKHQNSGKNIEKKPCKRMYHHRSHLKKMSLHNRRIRAMLKSGAKSGRPQALQAPSVSRIAAAHYHLNSTISGKHVLHPSHSTLAHDGDVYIGAPHAWAKHLGTDKFFLTNYGVLTVHERGLYIVYAQIYYDNRYDRNGYVVYHNTHPFLICSAYIPNNINKSHTCFTSGLIYLAQNDEIHIRDIHRDRVVSLSNAKSFFGLVKIDAAI